MEAAQKGVAEVTARRGTLRGIFARGKKKLALAQGLAETSQGAREEALGTDTEEAKEAEKKAE